MSNLQDIQYEYRGDIVQDSENLYEQQAMELSNKPDEDEGDIDDDNREDIDEDDDTFVKTKPNGFMQNNKENKNQYDFYLDSVSRSSNGDNADRDNDIDVVNITSNQSNSLIPHNLTHISVLVFSILTKLTKIRKT